MNINFFMFLHIFNKNINKFIPFITTKNSCINNCIENCIDKCIVNFSKHRHFSPFNFAKENPIRLLKNSKCTHFEFLAGNSTYNLEREPRGCAVSTSLRNLRWYKLPEYLRNYHNKFITLSSDEFKKLHFLCTSHYVNEKIPSHFNLYLEDFNFYQVSLKFLDFSIYDI